MPDHMTKTLLKPDTSGCKPFELNAFFPYRIRVFYTLVSSAVAGIYQQDHDIAPAEWRCLVILNLDGQMTAADIVLASSMDKVTVSRAISKMRQNGWVKESANINDRRSKLLELSDDGKAVLLELLPKTLEVERQLLDGIDDDQLAVFYDTIAKITANKARMSGR